MAAGTAGAEAMDLIARCVKNVVENPASDKFRRLKSSNPLVASKVLSVKGGR
jgi:hypothetical protein